MPTSVAVTGAAGQIGYALLFRIASGQMLGPDTKLALRLLEIPEAVRRPRERRWSCFDCGVPVLESVDIYDDPNQAFDGVNVALLVGARPRSKGMERADLLEANGQIFKPQGEALNAQRRRRRQGPRGRQPANTNALIAAAHAPDIPSGRINCDDAPG